MCCNELAKSLQKCPPEREEKTDFNLTLRAGSGRRKTSFPKMERKSRDGSNDWRRTGGDNGANR